jgi:hypothetical protein
MHDANFMTLAKYLITAAGLPTFSQVYEEVACKCLELIQLSVQSWQDEGLVVPGNNNTLVKCLLFNPCGTVRRNFWVIQLQKRFRFSSLAF